MNQPSQSERGVLGTAFRLLTFQSSREELLNLNNRHLSFGLIATWLVGVGRYWDHPKASLLQHLGVGSVLYVFALAVLLWLVVWPLRVNQWSYRRVLTFVALVSPPAILYAIPVERFFPLDTARTINVWFLLIVATWRVALLVFYLGRFGQLSIAYRTIITLLPLTLIVSALTMLNLEGVVFQVMAGIDESTQSANDTAYAILFLLTILSFLLFIPLIICYLYLIIDVNFIERRKKQSDLR